MKIRVGVIGSDDKISREVVAVAEAIGAEIARRNCVLVCGGRGGVMEAASRGAKKENGLVIGILPSFDKKEANPYVDIAVTTGMSHSRNALVAGSSDVLIAINGRAGTLSEIGLALCIGRPVVAVRGTGGVSEAIEEGLKKMLIDKKVHTADAEKAVALALSLIK